MSIVRAAQLVYARVEPAYSPQGKSGFQTVYKSNSLSPAEVEAIEKRIQCYLPGHPTLVRRQFFTLSNSTIVLTSTIAIDAHPEIVDKARRTGAFLAHCLVLSPTEFNKAEYNPFFIFDRFPFLNSPTEMVTMFGRAVGSAPTAEIEVIRPRYAPPSAWSGIEARRLIELALQAEQIANKRHSVLLVGRDTEIDEALRMVFSLLPKPNRLACTFDTCIDRCPTQPGLYWATGAVTRQGGSSYILVDTAKRQVISFTEKISDEDLYLVWLRHVSSKDDFYSAMDRAFTVQQLAKSFAEKRRLRLEELDENACREFMHLHRERVMQNLERAFTDTVGKSLGSELVRYFLERIEIRGILDVAAVQSIDPGQMCWLATEWIVERKPDLPDNDLRVLKDLAMRGRDMRLLHLTAVLGKKVDAKTRDEALENMNAQTFRKALDQLGDPVQPVDYVTRNHLSLLLSDSRIEAMDASQVVDLVKAIIRVDALDYLRALCKHIGSLPEDSLSQLEKLTRKHSDKVPQEFQVAVVARRQELGEPPGFLSFLQR